MLIVAGALGQEFGRKADHLRAQHVMRHQREEKDRKARAERTDNDLSEFADAALVVVGTDEVISFRAELDQFDTATIIALEDNRLALERVQEQADAVLERAHVLPDGRRVFKTEDGTQVIDEFGEEIEPDIIDSDDIDDSHPHWEEFEPYHNEEKRLIAEQTELLSYQEKLDAARERLDAGDITREEFDALRDELQATLPDAIRRHVPGMDHGPVQDYNPVPQAQAVQLDITEDMIPGTAPTTPGFGR